MPDQPLNGQYIIESMLYTTKVLDVDGGRANEGTPILLWENSDSPNQHWQLTRVVDENGEVFYTIATLGDYDETIMRTAPVMEAPGPWNPGDPIIMREYEQSTSGDQRHRHWKLIPVDPSAPNYKIMNRRSGFVIDIPAEGQGEKVAQYASWEPPDNRQKWRLVPIGLASGTVELINGSFEEPIVSTPIGYQYFSQDLVPGWRTTAADGIIEIWKSGYENVASVERKQHAELNATGAATLFQDLQTTPGTILYWRLSHRGTLGKDTMAVDIGPPGAVIQQQLITDDVNEWGRYRGTYVVPPGQTTTRFACRSVSTYGGYDHQGNLLDDVAFGTEQN